MLSQRRGSSYSRELALAVSRGAPLTVGRYLELATFGDVIALYKYWFYDVRRGSDVTPKAVKQLLFPTRMLRNASAHNGNLLDTLGKRLARPIGSIAGIAREVYGVDAELVALTRRFPIVHDLTALLRCHDTLVSGSDSRDDAANGLIVLSKRLTRHRGYFSKQAELANGLLVLGEIMVAASERLRVTP